MRGGRANFRARVRGRRVQAGVARLQRAGRAQIILADGPTTLGDVRRLGLR